MELEKDLKLQNMDMDALLLLVFLGLSSSYVEIYVCSSIGLFVVYVER